MTRLSDEQYTEYVELLKAWVEADKVLNAATPGPEAEERARAAYAAVEGFRERYSLGGAAVGALERSAREAR